MSPDSPVPACPRNDADTAPSTLPPDPARRALVATACALGGATGLGLAVPLIGAPLQQPAGRPAIAAPLLHPRLRPQRIPLAQARGLRLHRPGHPHGLLAHPAFRNRRRRRHARRLERRIPLPLPRLHLRPGRPRLPGQTGPRQPGNTAAPIPGRHHNRHRHRLGPPGTRPRKQPTGRPAGNMSVEKKLHCFHNRPRASLPIFIMSAGFSF